MVSPGYYGNIEHFQIWLLMEENKNKRFSQSFDIISHLVSISAYDKNIR